jgi:type IV pilus assembly protein PilM
MATKQGVWGIDVGQCALKALRVEMIGGTPTATAFDYVEHSKILSQPDADPDSLINEALQKFLSRNKVRGDLIAMSVPGQSGLARFVKLPPVEEKKINEIVKFEARQQIPFPLQEVVWDFQKLGSGTVTDGFAMETEIGLFAIKRETVQKYLSHFKDVSLEIHIVQMAPLALCNFISYDLLNKSAGDETPEEEKGVKKRAVVALDIGVDASNLVITDGDRIIWQRPIPLGGNAFTKALTKDMKLTFAKAEHLKRNATKSPDLKKILSSLKPVLNEFVGELQRSLGFFTSTHRDAQIEYLIGLGNAFRLPGLQKFIAEKLQLDVQKLQTINRLSGDSVLKSPAFTENMLSFGVAYGLALQGLKLPKLQTNLLPEEIHVERLIRSKKPMMVAAASLLLLGAVTMSAGMAMSYREVTAEPIEDSIKKGDSAVKEVESWKSRCLAKEAEIETNEKAVKSVIAGQDERLDWLRLSQYLSEILPDPTNLPKNPQIRGKYWNAAAERAHDNLAKRIAAPLSNDNKADEEKELPDLIQVNIEAVLPMFTNDLKVFYANLERDKKFDGMPQRDKDNPPEGPGWVVELRGFTYHRFKSEFLRETLVENIATLHRTPPPPPGTPAAPGAPHAGPVVATPGASGGKVAEATGDPINDKMSHPVLYDFKNVPNPQPGKFELIGTSFVKTLLTPAAGSGPPGTPGTPAPGGTAPGGAGGRSPETWQPLGSLMSNTGGYAGAAGPRGINPVAVPPVSGQPVGGEAGDKRLTRTEFVVLFIWREPTPSDKLMTPDEGPGAAPRR